MKTDGSEKILPGYRAMDELLHAGEREAQKRFGVEGFWNVHNLNAMFHETISAGLAKYIEGLPFFFLATSNAQGECDCSYRGCEFNASGKQLPLLRVLDANTVIFPDYRGNNLFNSFGNILVNPHVGMLFIDFQTITRVRLNGHAEILENRTKYIDIWPLAQRYVRVTAKQIYGNCKARIPRMKLVPPSDSDFQDD